MMIVSSKKVMKIRYLRKQEMIITDKHKRLMAGMSHRIRGRQMRIQDRITTYF